MGYAHRCAAHRGRILSAAVTIVTAIVVTGFAATACAASPHAATGTVTPGTPPTTGLRSDTAAPGATAASGTGGTGGAPGSTVPVATARLTGLTIDRTGGLTGFHQTITIAPNGEWALEDERLGTPQRGELTAAQRRELALLLADPAFAAEAGRTAPPGACNEAIVYQLTAAEVSFRYDDCDAGNRPAVDAVVSFVVAATPL